MLFGLIYDKLSSTWTCGYESRESLEYLKLERRKFADKLVEMFTRS